MLLDGKPYYAEVPYSYTRTKETGGNVHLDHDHCAECKQRGAKTLLSKKQSSVRFCNRECRKAFIDFCRANQIQIKIIK